MDKYKEALEKTRNLVKAGLIYEDTAIQIFPELKESEDEKIRKALVEHIKGIYKGSCTEEMCKERDMFLAWLEKQAKHDKVEPKFKAGNWIIFNGLILHIDEIVNGYYRTTSIGGIHNSYDWDIDNIARRWTITDAKDGDVLSYRDGQWIFIYKEIVTEDTFKYYALLSEKGITVNDVAFSLLTSCIIPATKEQCDLLFAKMKEAGYTFDFEKKELKKIGKKSAWSEEDETGLTNTIIMLKEGASLHFNIKDIAKAVNWLKSLKDRVRIQPQPKQEWNALDERNLQGVIDEIQANKNNAPDYDLPTYDRFLNWLKSLKDRMQPQL